MLTAEQIVEENMKNQKTVQFGKGKRTTDITTLAQEINRVKTGAVDYIVPADKITAEVVEDETGEKFEVRLTLDLGETREVGDRYKSYGLTNWAHGQLATKCGIPQKYYDRMQGTNKLNLLVDNINAWIHDNGPRRIRTLETNGNRHIRAIMSDRFMPLDNWIVAEKFLQGIVAHGLDPVKDVQACSITDTHMHVRATVPHMKEEIGAGHTLVQGMMITNSEVGASSFKVEPFLLDLLCTNGLIGPNALTRVHLGSKGEAGEFDFSKNIKGMELDLIQKKVGEIVDKVFDQDNFQKWIEQLRSATQVQINDVVECVNQFTALNNIKSMNDSILNQLAKEGPTQFGLVSAITRIAQDTPTFEAQTELERLAGEISVMSEKEFHSKIAIEV